MNLYRNVVNVSLLIFGCEYWFYTIEEEKDLVANTNKKKHNKNKTKTQFWSKVWYLVIFSYLTSSTKLIQLSILCWFYTLVSSLQPDRYIFLSHFAVFVLESYHSGLVNWTSCLLNLLTAQPPNFKIHTTGEINAMQY